MLVACSSLIATLKTLSVAASISVTGACPSYVAILAAPAGTVIDFSKATGNRLDITGVSSLTIKNYLSYASSSFGIRITGSSKILIVSPHLSQDIAAGVMIQYSDTIEVAGPWVTNSHGDGIDVVASTNVNVHDGACEDNIATATHPDCVQMWSTVGRPLKHIFVQGMTAIGRTQGFDLWDHSDFGATDIQFLNNHAAIKQANCIGAFYAHQLVISGNDCRTLLGSDGPAGLNVWNSPGASISNNSFGDASLPPS